MKKKQKREFRDWRERAKETRPGNIEQFVNAEIKRRDWINYANPVVGRHGKVERSLADAVLLATKGHDPEPNEIEVLAQLVGLAYIDRNRGALESIRGDYKQLEIVLPAPISRRVFLFSDEGELYICDTPITPFPEDN